MESTSQSGRERGTSVRRLAVLLPVPRGLIAILGAVIISLLALQPGQAQNGPALMLRQMQAQIASLTQANRMQAQVIQRTNAERQATTQRLQRLQAALNAAAAAGDPDAQALRGRTPEAALDKLILQLNTRARQRRGPPPPSTEIPAPDLSGAKLAGARLGGVKLEKAILTGTDLTGADLTNAALPGSNLRGARLQGADLTGVNLAGADLTNALYDAHTRWPTGVDPAKRGALLVK